MVIELVTAAVLGTCPGKPYAAPQLVSASARYGLSITQVKGAPLKPGAPGVIAPQPFRLTCKR